MGLNGLCRLSRSLLAQEKDTQDRGTSAKARGQEPGPYSGEMRPRSQGQPQALGQILSPRALLFSLMCSPLCSLLLEVAHPRGFEATSELPTIPRSSAELQSWGAPAPRRSSAGCPSALRC